MACLYQTELVVLLLLIYSSQRRKKFGIECGRLRFGNKTSRRGVIRGRFKVVRWLCVCFLAAEAFQFQAGLVGGGLHIEKLNTSSLIKTTTRQYILDKFPSF